MRFSKLNVDEFKANVTSGASDVQLAKLYGVAEKTISRWRDQLGLASHWRPKLAPCGTQAAYARGCRCVDCTRANRDAHRVAISKMKDKGLAPDDERHGTATSYSQWGCRCDRCKSAWAATCRAQYERVNGPVSEPWWTEREMFALRVLPPAEASKRLGRSLSAVYAKRHRAGLSSRIES